MSNSKIGEQEMESLKLAGHAEGTRALVKKCANMSGVTQVLSAQVLPTQSIEIFPQGGLPSPTPY